MPELTIEKALELAVDAHKAGDFTEADKYYTAILKIAPNHPDANHNMGVLAVNLNKTDKSLPFFWNAVKSNPTIQQFWLSLIDTLVTLSQEAEAKSAIQQAQENGVDENALKAFLEKLKAQETTKLNLNQETNATHTSQNNVLDSLTLNQALQKASKETKAENFDNAKRIYTEILQKFPKNHRAKTALLNLKAQETTNLNPPQMELNQIKDLYQKELFEQAIDKTNKLIEKFPNSTALYNIKGAIFAALGITEQAINSYEKALSIDPNFVEAMNNIGNIYIQKHQNHKAITFFKRAIEIRPRYFEAHINMGNSLKKIGQLKEAERIYQKALKIKPRNADTYFNLGNTLKDQYRLDDAIEAYVQAIKIEPSYCAAYVNLGNAFKENSQFEEALTAYSKALELTPNDADIYNNIGTVFLAQDHTLKAIEAFEKSIDLNPNNAPAYNNLGNAFRQNGDLCKSDRQYKKAIETRPDFSEAHLHLSSLKTYSADDHHFLQVKELYSNQELDSDSKCNLNFALAKMYEDIGNIDKTFEHLQSGNKLRKEKLKYSIETDKQLFSLLRRTQASINRQKLSDPETESEIKPIFIVGMPRSGTTLIEQILSSHSKVTGAGELVYVAQFGGKIATGLANADPESITNFRQRYLGEVSKLSKGNKFVVDKMPQNFRFIPLICAALPEAKIVHVTRDPMATCWSNFKHNFATNSLGYAYDFNDVQTYIKLYEDLMETWYTCYTDRIFHLNYERLTVEQEETTRSLISHLELPWEAACLNPQDNTRSVRTASQEQIRKKIYKGSSQAWLKYKKLIEKHYGTLA